MLGFCSVLSGGCIAMSVCGAVVSVCGESWPGGIDSCEGGRAGCSRLLPGCWLPWWDGGLGDVELLSLVAGLMGQSLRGRVL